jgi:FixJ family two-component response regulator
MGACYSSSSLARPQRDLAMSVEAKQKVLIVDENPGIWRALICFVQSIGMCVEFSSAVPEFLSSGRPDTPICLILDVRLPGRDCLDFQRKLATAGMFVPIIFVIGCADVSTSVQAMKNCAIDFLTKPFEDQDLLTAIQPGLARDHAWCAQQRAIALIRGRFETLTQREREVMTQVVRGRLNKQIAGDLGISEITVEAHRGRMMRKMKVNSLPDLARMADRMAPIPLVLARSAS